MNVNENDLFQYLSDFYQTVDAKLNFLTQSVGMLKGHMTRLYGLKQDFNFPPARGHLKMKQDGCLKLLHMIDGVLRDAGIEYFLGYGNLLGAARTGGFIPWDDDIDICLMRDDFNRAVTVLSQHFNHDGFFTTWGISGGIFKVLFTNKICVDLFPWDTYHTRMETDEAEQRFHEDYMAAMNAAREMESDRQALAENPDAIVGSKYKNYDEIRNDIIMNHIAPDKAHGDIFEGIDWQTYPERMAHFFHEKPFRREWIFPLGTIDFCGASFPAPNNVDAVLTTRFGDWGEFRPDFSRHSSPPFTYDELQMVRKFLEIKQ